MLSQRLSDLRTIKVVRIAYAYSSSVHTKYLKPEAAACAASRFQSNQMANKTISAPNRMTVGVAARSGLPE
jgi:hypothetical protein